MNSGLIESFPAGIVGPESGNRRYSLCFVVLHIDILEYKSIFIEITKTG